MRRCRAGAGGTFRQGLRAWSENLSDAVLDIEEKVIDESLDVWLCMRSRESTQARCEYPHMEVRHREPRLERRREMTLYRSQKRQI